MFRESLPSKNPQTCPTENCTTNHRSTLTLQPLQRMSLRYLLRRLSKEILKKMHPRRSRTVSLKVTRPAPKTGLPLYRPPLGRAKEADQLQHISARDEGRTIAQAATIPVRESPTRLGRPEAYNTTVAFLKRRVTEEKWRDSIRWINVTLRALNLSAASE